MNILFIHQNFPGQYKHLAPALVRQGHNVKALAVNSQVGSFWQGVNVIKYTPTRRSTPNLHPWLIDTETKVIRGEAVYMAALQLKKSGFHPDAVIAHPGWGESLFIKEVWPSARLGLYFEFFYHAEGADVGFDPEFDQQDDLLRPRMRAKNFNNLLHLDLADAGLSPTVWQASTFPNAYQRKITVIHDGIDTNVLSPNPNASLQLTLGSGQKLLLTAKDELITFVNRNLEPSRGYHQFMRALPAILRQRPTAQVLIVGGDGVSYGARPDPARFGARTWKQIFIDEVSDQIGMADWHRVHFLGRVPYPQFIALLQISRVHVYLTYPFVLSWSFLEAMSVGCAIVASDTAPVKEAIKDGERGRLVDFFNHDNMAEEVCSLLDDAKERRRLGENAREFATQHYDLKSVCLPRQLQWIKEELVSNAN